MGVWSREGGPIRSLVRLSSRPARRLSAALPALLLIASLLVGLAPPVALAQAKPGTVTGTVFRDDDGNGKRDGNAAGVAGVTVTIANGRWQAQAVTGSDGSFRFADLLEATYNVRIVPPDGYRRTTPDSLNARVGPGATVQADFGLMRATPTPTPPPATPTRGATPTTAGTAPAAKTSATPGAAKPEIEPKPATTAESKPETRALVPNAPSLVRPSPAAEAAEDDEEDAPPPRSALFPGAPARLTPVVSPSDAAADDRTPTATPTPTPRPAPRFGGRSSGLSRPEPPTWPREPAPVEADALDRFLAARDSPMAGLGKKLLDVGWRYNVDPRLLVAIAGADTSFGRALCTDYNAWNWFWFEWCNSPFESWEQAAEEVARGIRVGYLDQGLTDVDKIADRYGPLDDPRDTLGLNRHWPVNVSRYIEQLGGSRCNLTWTRTGATCAPPRPTPTPRPPTATPAPAATAAPPDEPSARRRADGARADARARPPVADDENDNDTRPGPADDDAAPPDVDLTAQGSEDEDLHPSDRAAAAIGTPIPPTAAPATPVAPSSTAETTAAEPEATVPDTTASSAAGDPSEPGSGPAPAALLAIGLLGLLLVAAWAALVGPLRGRTLALGPIQSRLPGRLLRLGRPASARQPEPDFAGPTQPRRRLPRLRMPRFRPFRGRGATDRGVLS